LGGLAHCYLGNHDAAIEHFAAAIRLSPVDPHLFLPQTGMASLISLPGGMKKVCLGPLAPSSANRIFRAHSEYQWLTWRWPDASPKPVALARKSCKPTPLSVFSGSKPRHFAGSKMSKD
jgi:hypothetical protein